jgi:hypothetical protein
MTPDQRFTQWLAGFAELQPNPPNAEQWKAIKDRLHEALGHAPQHAGQHTQPPNPTPDTVVAGATATPSAHEHHIPPLHA